jgi:hypothetical protein
LAELVKQKFADGWSKARIARELRLNRRTVSRICTAVESTQSKPPEWEIAEDHYQTRSMIRVLSASVRGTIVSAMMDTIERQPEVTHVDVPSSNGAP